MPHYQAVLFDWMLTLADYPLPAEMLRRAAAECERSLTSDEVDRFVDALDLADADASVVTAMGRVDCSSAEHRTAEMLKFATAGLDEELAEAFYVLLGQPGVHVVYAEVPALLAQLSGAGIRIVVISDIHVDLREHARLAGIDSWIDGWVLSYEHGIQKPDPAIYAMALAESGVAAAEALMVGDRHISDGSASLLGIDSLVLPARRERDPSVADSRLDGVARLVL
jgi:HAD superfamily hydrolase (TIGR01549 family)